MSDDDSVPVWSTTRPVSCGTATSASTIVARQTSSVASSALTADNARKRNRSRYFEGWVDGALKSTFGATEISRSFSTVKLAFSL